MGSKHIIELVLVSPGVWLIALPLPFELDIINVYLLRLSEGYLLIDCGLDTPECFSALDRARAEIGIEWRDIREILLTHIHPDHMGLAPRLLELSGARLMMHPEDLAVLTQIASQGTERSATDATLSRAGVPPELIDKVDAAFAQVMKNFRKLDPDRLLAGGEEIDTAMGPLEVIWTPGHSPGHLCLYDRQRKTLFSGDHILENISPNIGWQPDADPLGDYLASLEQIARLDVDLILPSHGSPFHGHREWIENALAHHRERCDRILSLLRERSKTAHELTRELWPRRLSPFHFRFAIFEVLAHMVYLSRGGKVRELREGPVTKWAAGRS